MLTHSMHTINYQNKLNGTHTFTIKSHELEYLYPIYPSPNHKPVGCLMYISAHPWHQQAHRCCSTLLFSLGVVPLLPTLLPNTNLSTGEDSLSPGSPMLLLDHPTPSPESQYVWYEWYYNNNEWFVNTTNRYIFHLIV